MGKEEARAWFRSQQNLMRAGLGQVRVVHDHPTAKGDGTEEGWLAVLRNRLPDRYRAQRAFVVDADGERSEQIDIVIHDRQFCPLLLDAAGAVCIPAESVYAAIEVKQDLTKAHLQYAGEKIESVRRLRRTAAEFPHAHGRSRTEAKPILGGIVAFESGWSPPLGQPFEEALRASKDLERIDFGCALSDGGFEATYQEDGSLHLTRSAADSSLVFFFLRLLHRLQQMATVPAIDYLEYTRLLVSGEDEAATAAGFHIRS